MTSLSRSAGTRARCHSEEPIALLKGTDNLGTFARVGDELDDGRIEISLRAKRGYNVSNAAVALGGGGHPLTAGTTIDGPLDAATQQVLLALKQYTT